MVYNMFVDLNHAMSVALKAVQKASSVIMGFYQAYEPVEVQKKADNSPLTKADLASNQIICDTLSQSFPCPILSEESEDGFSRLASEYVWIVDPLDGTKEFIAKNDEFTVNVALVKEGRPILGIVSVPAKALIYSAIAGGGAYVTKEGESHQIHCSRISTLKEMRLSVSRSHFSPILRKLLEENNITNFAPMGSALKYCAIAEGLTDASLRLMPLKEWDICAADCVLTEAGGKMTDFDGKRLMYNQQKVILDHGIVASNSVINQPLLGLITLLEPIIDRN